VTRGTAGHRRISILVGAAVIVAGALTGCAPSSTALSHDAAAAMQRSVASVADSAAAGDSSSALAMLDGLQAQLDRAIADGDVSAARAAAIQSAIDLVRADLQPVSVPAPEPATTTPADTGDAVDTGGNAGTAEEDAGEGNGNSGSGNGNGNGNSGSGNGNGNGSNSGNGNSKPDKDNGKAKD